MHGDLATLTSSSFAATPIAIEPRLVHRIVQPPSHANPASSFPASSSRLLSRVIAVVVKMLHSFKNNSFAPTPPAHVIVPTTINKNDNISIVSPRVCQDRSEHITRGGAPFLMNALRNNKLPHQSLHSYKNTNSKGIR